MIYVIERYMAEYQRYETTCLDPGLDVLAECLELLHVTLLGGPVNSQALSLVGLRDLRE